MRRLMKVEVYKPVIEIAELRVLSDHRPTDDKPRNGHVVSPGNPFVTLGIVWMEEMGKGVVAEQDAVVDLTPHQAMRLAVALLGAAYDARSTTFDFRPYPEEDQDDG